MPERPTAQDILQGQEELYKTRPGAPIVDAAIKMRSKGISALPVFDSDGKFLGIISKSDINRAFLGQKSGGCVADIMTYSDKIIFAAPGDTIEKCKAVMIEHGITHLPVRDEKGNIPGMISSLDIMMQQHTRMNEVTQQAHEMPQS